MVLFSQWKKKKKKGWQYCYIEADSEENYIDIYMRRERKKKKNWIQRKKKKVSGKRKSKRTPKQRRTLFELDSAAGAIMTLFFFFLSNPGEY